MKKINNIKYFSAGLIAIGFASLVIGANISMEDLVIRIIGVAHFLAGIFFLSGCQLVRESINPVNLEGEKE